MSNQERLKPRRRPYVKVGSCSRAGLGSIAERINSSKDLAYAVLVAEWALCLVCITFF